MNRILTLVIAALLGIAIASGAPKESLEWSATTHDFGNIHSSAGKVKAEYVFKNNGSEAVAILSVTNGGCGCTVPAFTKKPIPPGGEGTVTITFDPARFKGEFRRQVTVTVLDGSRRVKSKLKFTGYIIPD